MIKPSIVFLLLVINLFYFSHAGIVKGIVTDMNGEPLPFASVYIKGSTIGTATNPEGVFFLGNRRDVLRIMRALDVFVLCSLNEGISNTILEAMATRLPVIATNVGGNPDLVLDSVTGKLFPAGNVEALMDQLLAYIHSPEERRRHAKRGRDIAIANYNILSMVDGYEAVWRRVAAQRLVMTK